MNRHRNGPPQGRCFRTAIWRALLVSAIVATGVSVPVAAPPASAAPNCDAPSPPPICEPGFKASPTGTLTGLSRIPAGLQVSGTATDPDAPGPVAINFYSNDTTFLGTLRTAGGSFSGVVRAVGGYQHVCAMAINRNYGDNTTLNGCRWLTVNVLPFGTLDFAGPGPAGLHIGGWSIDPDSVAPITVHVYVDSVGAAFAAGLVRGDVGAAYPVFGPAHGFDVTIAAAPGPHQVCVYAINTGPGASNPTIGCTTVIQGGPPGRPQVQGRPSADPQPKVSLLVTPTGRIADSILVQRFPQGGGALTDVHLMQPGGGEWDDTHVRPGVGYCYRVTARNAYGTSQADDWCGGVPLPALRPPTNFTSSNTQTSITINWTDNAADEDRYVVNRNGANTLFTPAAPGTGRRVTATITGLRPGTGYCFYVAAVKTGHDAHKVTFCTATAPVPPKPTPPPPPAGGVKQVLLWNCHSDRYSGVGWMFDRTTGVWTRVGSAPSSWTEYGCGAGFSSPAAVYNLPNGHIVNLVLVIVDGSSCTADDPTSSGCRHWEADNVYGDAKGLIVPVNVG